MFVRFRETGRRLQCSLIETRRVDGKVRHEHIASLGSIEYRSRLDCFLGGAAPTAWQAFQPVQPRTRCAAQAWARVAGLIRKANSARGPTHAGSPATT
jgi:hypothetical protein